jgi:hypothetical protein
MESSSRDLLGLAILFYAILEPRDMVVDWLGTIVDHDHAANVR